MKEKRKFKVHTVNLFFVYKYQMQVKLLGAWHSICWVYSGFSQRTRVVVHRLHQHAHALRRCELADAVAQIEDLGGARRGGVGMWFAKSVQHAANFSGNGIGGGKQRVGVQVALQGLARAAH